MTAVATDRSVRAASLEELRAKGRLVVHLDRHTLCLFAEGEEVYAVDNRCPHMGFPLHRGTVCDGILTCHWHHARFDLATGGTFDQFADELRRFPVTCDGDDVLVDLSPREDPVGHQRKRLEDGLERDIPLVLAKATIALLEADASGLDLVPGGDRLRRPPPRRGLVPRADDDYLPDEPRSTARRAASAPRPSTTASPTSRPTPRRRPPRFPLDPLPGEPPEPARLAEWFRSFIEVRDAEGAERALVSAVRAGATPTRARGHAVRRRHRPPLPRRRSHARLRQQGARSARRRRLGARRGGARVAARAARLRRADGGVERVAQPGRPPRAARGARSRELPEALAEGAGRAEAGTAATRSSTALLEDEAAELVEALLDALRAGATEVELASAVSFAAATRIARFPTSNDFGDWDTALHTFTFANAVEQGLRRSPSLELLRGVFDARRQRPPRPLPERAGRRGSRRRQAGADPDALLDELPRLLDRQQQVDEAGQLAASFLGAGGEPATVRRRARRRARPRGPQLPHDPVRRGRRPPARAARGTDGATLPLLAAARYLAAHATTTRSQRQTFDIARRLHRGERLYEEVD